MCGFCALQAEAGSQGEVDGGGFQLVMVSICCVGNG